MRSMPSTYYKQYKNIISPWLKKKGEDTVDSPLSGITQAKRCISRCQNTSKMPLSASSTPPQSYHKINHTPTSIKYMGQVQHAMAPDYSVPLDNLGKQFIQEVTGVFMFLARVVDSTMLTPLSALTSKQAAPTEKKHAKMPAILGLCSIARQSHHNTMRAT